MTDAGELEALVSQQIVTAMKAHDAERTGTLRLIKNALKNKAIEKREPLTQAESEQALATMIKQRRDSIDQFAKGNRPDLVAKEQAEIVVIEEFLPKALDEAGLARLVAEAIGELTADAGAQAHSERDGPGDEGGPGQAAGGGSARRWAPGERVGKERVNKLGERIFLQRNRACESRRCGRKLIQRASETNPLI